RSRSLPRNDLVCDRMMRLQPQTRKLIEPGEIEISLFSRQCLGTRRISSLTRLQAEARAWNQQMNTPPNQNPRTLHPQRIGQSAKSWLITSWRLRPKPHLR